MYFITTVTYDYDQEKFDTKCVGYYSDYLKAVNAVWYNKNNIYEGIYNYCVIEEVDEGINNIDFNPVWCKWTGNGYRPCERPNITKMFVGWWNA